MRKGEQREAAPRNPCPESPRSQEMQCRALPGKREAKQTVQGGTWSRSWLGRRRRRSWGGPGFPKRGGSLALALRVPQFGRRRSSNRF